MKIARNNEHFNDILHRKGGIYMNTKTNWEYETFNHEFLNKWRENHPEDYANFKENLILNDTQYTPGEILLCVYNDMGNTHGYGISDDIDMLYEEVEVDRENFNANCEALRAHGYDNFVHMNKAQRERLERYLPLEANEEIVYHEYLYRRVTNKSSNVLTDLQLSEVVAAYFTRDEFLDMLFLENSYACEDPLEFESFIMSTPQAIEYFKSIEVK